MKGLIMDKPIFHEGMASFLERLPQIAGVRSTSWHQIQQVDDKSQSIFKIFQPIDVEQLLVVKTVVPYKSQMFMRNSQLSQVLAQGLHKILREGFDDRPSVLIGVLNIQSAILSLLIGGRECEGDDLKVLLIEYGMDSHGLWAAFLCNTNSDFIHLFLLGSLLVLRVALMVETQWGLNIGQQSYLLILNLPLQLDQSIQASSYPPSLFKFLLVHLQIGQHIRFSFYFILEDKPKVSKLIGS